MWMIIAIVLMGPASSPAFDPCTTIYQLYDSHLKVAATGGSGKTEALAYLKRLESTVKNCFDSARGKGLIAKRQAIEHPRKPAPPLPLRLDARKTHLALVAIHNRVLSVEELQRMEAARLRRAALLPSASAALCSLVVPGLGQALQGRPLPAWLFLVGSWGIYAGTAIVAGAIASGPRAYSSAESMWIGFTIGMGVGFAIHLWGMIDAAVWTPPTVIPVK